MNLNQALRMVAVVAAFGVLSVIGRADSAGAYGWPCEPSWSGGGQGPCYASMSAGRTAAFWVNPGFIYVAWNTWSTTQFYAYPVNGYKQAEATSHSLRTWTASAWPSGTFQVAQWVRMEGKRYDISYCIYSDCYVTLTGPGGHYSGTDFDYQASNTYGPVPPGVYPWVDDNSKVRMSASFWPSDGAGSATSNSYGGCRNLTASGAQSNC